MSTLDNWTPPLSPKAAAEFLCRDYANNLPSDAEFLDIDGIQVSIWNKVASIRGSDDRRDWWRNFAVLPTVLLGDSGNWWVHGALINARTCYAFLKGKPVDLIIGHSAGGASAQIVGASLGIPVWTFASPRALYRGTPKLRAPITNYIKPDDPIRFLYLFADYVGDVEMLAPSGAGTLARRHGMGAYLESLST